MSVSGPVDLTWQRSRNDTHTYTWRGNLQLEESSSGKALPLAKIQLPASPPATWGSALSTKLKKILHLLTADR